MGPKAGSASGCLAEGAAAQSRWLHGGQHSLPSLLALQALTSQEQSLHIPGTVFCPEVDPVFPLGSD